MGKAEEREQLKALQEQRRKLELLVSKKLLELEKERAYVEIACEEANIDVDSFRKKTRKEAKKRANKDRDLT